MRSHLIIWKSLSVLIFSVMLWSCAENEDIPSGQGAPLDLSISFGNSTRLAELPNPDAMSTEMNGNGLKNVGVYIYYADDYASGDLSKPYVRNMEFKVENGRLLAVTSSGVDSDQFIYIYDKMTIVAFYPYNADMSLPENYFTAKADEEKYPITRNDYADQYYIPYRAQTDTDPTVAYYTVLTFQPKHTYKLEVIVVAADKSIFPSLAEVQILPGNDPVTTTDTSVDGKREKWYDDAIERVNDTSGSDIQLYTTYVWTRDGNRNEIKKGDVLLKSDELTLIAAQDLYTNEQRIYRYGYNMSTGEIFIPTSSNLVYDTSTLKAVDGTGASYYQVCDIDVSKITSNWDPISLLGGRYDGGGHKISNVTINSTGADEVGLFGRVQGNTVVANVNLQNPKITVNQDSCYVGGLVGRLNTPMSEAEKQKLIGNLPEGLSGVVREALIQEILASAGNSQADIVACKVTNPEIVVTGKDPVVGGLVGQAGEKNEAGSSKSRIWDSAVLGGSIKVNESATADNANAYVGGFVGLNEGYIGRTYTTVPVIIANADGGLDGDNNPIVIDKGNGFGVMGTDFSADESGLIESSYSQRADNNSGVKQWTDEWPSWSTYTGIWPVEIVGWLGFPSSSFWYNNGTPSDTYPILQWERR